MLPTEILLHICSCLVPTDSSPPSSLAAVSLASRLFNQISEEYLYRVVALRGYRRILSFLLSLLARPSRGLFVHELGLHWENGRTPFGEGGFDYGLKSAFVGAFLAEHQLALSPPPRRPASALIVAADPVDLRIADACARHGLHADLRRGLARDCVPPYIILLLRLLPSISRLAFSGPHSDSWICESLLFPSVTSAFNAPAARTFRGLRQLSVNFQHSVHANYILACMILPGLEELEIDHATDAMLQWHTRGVGRALRAIRGTSSITRLYIADSCLSGLALAEMLGAPRELREFGYHRAGAWVKWYAEDWAAIADALQQQLALSRLELIEQLPSTEDAPGTLGIALRELKSLSHVHVPWRALVRSQSQDSAGQPHMLRDVLPSGVTNLVLRNDAGWDIKSRAEQLLELLSHCSYLSDLDADVPITDDVAEAEATDFLKAACIQRSINFGANRVSSWDWMFHSPSSHNVKLKHPALDSWKC
jgi:hypothetical protein